MRKVLYVLLIALLATVAAHADYTPDRGEPVVIQIDSQAPLGTQLELCQVGLKKEHASELFVDNGRVLGIDDTSSGYALWPQRPNAEMLSSKYIQVKFGGLTHKAGFFVGFCWKGHQLVDHGASWLGYEASFLSKYGDSNSTDALSYLRDAYPTLKSEVVCSRSQQTGKTHNVTYLNSLTQEMRVGHVENDDTSCMLKVYFDETSDRQRSVKFRSGWLKVTPLVISDNDGHNNDLWTWKTRDFSYTSSSSSSARSRASYYCQSFCRNVQGQCYYRGTTREGRGWPFYSYRYRATYQCRYKSYN